MIHVVLVGILIHMGAAYVVLVGIKIGVGTVHIVRLGRKLALSDNFNHFVVLSVRDC